MAKVIPNPVRSGDVLPEIKTRVLPQTMIFSDESYAYDALNLMGWSSPR